jgi:hypothetical protein
MLIWRKRSERKYTGLDFAPSRRPQNRRIIFGIARFSNRHNHLPANWALFHAVSEGRFKKLSGRLRKLRIGKPFFSVLRHETPAHIRRLSCVINEAKRMYSVEGAIGVACRRIVRLQKMKLRSLVGMLLHKGGELARISFSGSRVLSESQEFVQKRGRRSREEHRRMYHSDVMQGAVFEAEF